MSDDGKWPDDIQTQWIAQLVYCVASTIGCLFIIISFLYLKINKVHYQYVVCLAISQLILALNGLVACLLAKLDILLSETDILCKLQASLLTIGQKSGWMYVTLISLNMVALSRGHTDNYMKSKGVWIHLFSWVIINIGFIGGLWHTFGPAVLAPLELCWTQEYAVVYALYAPMGVFGALNAACIIYIVVKYIIDFKKNKEVRTNLLTARRDSKVYLFLLRISFYPCIFLIIAGVMSIGRYYFDIAPEDNKPVWTTYLLQSVFAEGFFCAIAYGFTPSLRIKYAKIYRRISAKPTLDDAWNSASSTSPPFQL